MLFTLSLAHRILRPRVSFVSLNMLHPWPTHTVMQQERNRFNLVSVLTTAIWQLFLRPGVFEPGRPPMGMRRMDWALSI